MSNNSVKSTHDFYADLRTLLQTGGEQKVSGPRLGGMSMGVGRGSTAARSTDESATQPTVLVRKQQVEVAQTRALKSLKELARRNQEAELRAKATVHANSSRFLKMLEKNPDVRDGDPLFFFGYGLESMEDIIYSGFCQVNTSVNLYLEEIDTRFNNLLVMAEDIDRAAERVKQLREEAKEETRQTEMKQQAWLNDIKEELKGHWLQFLAKREAIENQRLKEIEKSNRWIRRSVTVLALLVLLLGVINGVLVLRMIL
jgi:hypothetical protein